MCCTTLKRKSDSDCHQPPRKKLQRMIMSSLPDRMLQPSEEVLSPEHLVMKTLAANDIQVQSLSYSDMTGFFQPPTAEEISAYDHDSITAIRTQNVDLLKQFHAEGRPLKCSNQFGESLLHMACRKGMLDVVKFMTQEAHVPWQVCDDYGRSPLHDACWAHTTNFALVDLILQDCPDLLFVKDKRGNTPLSYLKQAKWAAWTEYLQSKPASFFQPQHSCQLLA